MKKILTSLFLSSLLFYPSPTPAVPLTVSPQLLEKSISLYAEKDGPFELHYRSDLRLHELGFQISTYTLLSAGSEAGYVTRVTALMSPDADGYFDLLLRLDAQKRIAGSVNLVQSESKDPTTSSSSQEMPLPSGGANFDAFLHYLQGKDASEYQEVLTALINGLASGANLRDVEPLPPPPADFVLDTTGKILLPGNPLPVVKTQDLQGQPFSTEKMKGKVIIVFTAPTCAGCDGMIETLEKGLDLSGKRHTVKLVYVVGSEAPEALTYLSRLKAKGTGIAEPDDKITQAMKVPFRPYILMFEDGKMKFNFVWENDESKLYGFLYLLIEGKEPEGED
jgi:thiol-disulfide isomerase/thioredoxin